MRDTPTANHHQFPSISGSILSCLAIGVVISTLTSSPFVLVDDAYITFRYVHNLVHSGQLVFNHNEYVEAITNFLWAISLIPSAWLRLTVEVYAVGLSLCLVAFACWRLLLISRLLTAELYAGWLGIILLVGASDFMGAAGNGLEAALYAALLAETVYAHTAGRVRHAFAAAGLLFLTRPEGLVFGAFLAILSPMRGQPWRTIVQGLWIFISIVSAITLFRYAYYGSIVPNSVIAKSIPLTLNVVINLFARCEARAMGSGRVQPASRQEHG